MKTQNERLRAARKAAGYKSAREAWEKFEWNENTYRAHEAGPREIGKDNAVKYAAAFGVSLMWLLTGAEDVGSDVVAVGGLQGDKPQTRETQLLLRSIESRVVPIVGAEAFAEMAKGNLLKLTEKARGFGSVAAKGMSDRVYLYELEDEGMKGSRFPDVPELFPGDLLVIDMAAPPLPGKPVLAGVQGIGAVLARIYGIESNAAGDDMEYVLSAKSSFYPEKQRFRKDELAFRYRIVAVQRRL